MHVEREFIEFEPVSYLDRRGERIVIRRYDHKTDREKLISMYQTFSPENRCLGLPPSTRIAIEQWVDYLAENGFSLIAEHRGRIIGHCSLVPTKDWKYVDLSLFVHQDYQDRGIGQKLLELAIEYSRKMGFEGITLVTEKDNRRALHIYTKFGFAIVNPEYEYDLFLPLK